MKNRILKLAILLLVWLATSSQLWAQQATPNGASHENNEFQQLMQKIRQDFAVNPPARKIEEDLKTYNDADGSFTDVTYIFRFGKSMSASPVIG